MQATSSFFDRSPESLDVASFDAEMLDAVIDHWHMDLMRSENRDTTLRFLGISTPLATRLRIGVSDRTLGLRIPGRRWKAGLLMRTRLEEFGILRASGHEAFRGCVVIPLIHDGEVTGLFARRLDRSREEFWATGLSSSIFEVASGEERDKVLVASSVLNAVSVLGALEGLDESALVVAPGSARGFSSRDVKELASRFDHVIALGRGSSTVAERFQRSGLVCSIAGEDCAVWPTLTASAHPASVLGAWLENATILAVAPNTEYEATSKLSPSASTSPVVTSTPDRDEVFVRFNTRAWRVRGARSKTNIDGEHLQVALSVTDRDTGRFHLDTLDLYLARQRHGFLDATVTELRAGREVLALEMAEVLGVAERLRDEGIQEVPATAMSDEDRRAAQSYLGDPELFCRIVADLSELGVVGEATNLLVCYLATISRKCERPLGVLVQSSSAGGKSTLVDAVCALVPDEDLVALSAITSQALYYLGSGGLTNKVLYVTEEHGAQRASYALKLLLSEGRLAIASTGKDQRSGRLQTTNYETSGPVALLMTTTATSIDPELENRMVVLGVDEDARQTEAIIQAQRRAATREGFALRLRREELCHSHANVQRLLEPLRVVINDVPVDFPSSSTRHRRDHAKLLSLIAAITLLHQYQREHLVLDVDGESVTYLEATDEDVARGVALATTILASPDDHLAPQAQRLLDVFEQYAAQRSRESGLAVSDLAVTRRELREWLGWSHMQVRSATDALVALEYLVVAGGGRGRCRTYRLVGDVVHVGVGSAPTCSTSSSGTTSKLVELVHNSSQEQLPTGVVAAYEQEVNQ